MRKRLSVLILAGFLLVLSACSSAEIKEVDTISTEEFQDEETASTEGDTEEGKDTEAESTEQTEANHTIQTFEIPEGWGYQFSVPKIGSFKEYTEESPACPVDMEGGMYFGYEDRLDAGCSTWCGCESYYCEATASSSLAEQGTQTYGAENLIYTSRMNAWAEGVPGDGIGESIEIREMYYGIGEDVFRYNEVCIVNGYAKNETTWQENNRVKSMKLYFADEYVGTIMLEDTMLPQYVDLSPVSIRVSNGCKAKFRFEIAEVYKGTKYDDTCISGIVVEFEGRYAH